MGLEINIWMVDFIQYICIVKHSFEGTYTQDVDH